jgi:long-chain acyl-CoA synthetase
MPKNGYYSWEEIINQKNVEALDINIQEDDPVYLNFTSGSTGIPKGALTTHANIYWNTKSAVESLGLNQDDIHLCCFPVFNHPHELFARALFLGGTMVLTDDTLPKTIASAVSEHGVTCLMAISVIYENLVHYNASPLELRTLRLAESGGMYVRPALAEAFKNRFNIPIIPVWGSTEATGIALAMPVKGECRSGSMGKPCPYYEVKIVDEDGTELDRDEVGEMAVKGPAVCSKYFDNPEETEKHIRDGWLYTGDLVKKDNEGYFYFIGRKSGMIKVAGLRVYPAEIEEVLITHPEVKEAAVVKLQDSVLGEVPKAVVVLKSNSAVNQEELRKYCARRIAKYKVPATIEFVKELPKTPSGKIQYQKLQLAAEALP